uniref:HAD-IA family hydrolase n=1 Tax=Actibacterium sp. TaxID=1872125 RepID=UPI003566EFE1
YPGAIQAVDRLRAEKIAVGICTNKPAGLADKLLTRLGVREAFASLIGSDSLPTRKPDPAPYRAAVTGAGGLIQRSLLIGDTITDRDTARNAGVPCVLVTFGALGHAVADLAPSALLDHFDDLPDLVTRLLP